MSTVARRSSSLSPSMLCASAGCAALAFASFASADIVVGAGAGGLPNVAVHGGAGGAGGGTPSTFMPYTPSFSGGVRVAAGDVNGDGAFDYVTGTGAGAAASGGHVKVFDGTTGAEIRSFLAYGPAFSGGVHVAAGDVNGDGRADVITGTGAGAPGGHVKVFSGATGAELRSFFAFDGFAGGVRVAAGDVDGDGRDDVITAAGPGGNGHVKVFSGATGAEVRSFFAFGGFSGGVYVAAGDVNGDGWADIVAGIGDDDADSAAAHVKVFDGQTGGLLASFFAFDPAFQGGVRVAAGDVDGDGRVEIITGAGVGAGPHVKVFDGMTGQFRGEFFSQSSGSEGGIYVAAIPAPASVLPLGMLLAAAARRRR